VPVTAATPERPAADGFDAADGRTYSEPDAATPGQAARAELLAAQRRRGDRTESTPWDELPEDYRRDWEGIAQAAIAAQERPAPGLAALEATVREFTGWFEAQGYPSPDDRYDGDEMEAAFAAGMEAQRDLDETALAAALRENQVRGEVITRMEQACTQPDKAGIRHAAFTGATLTRWLADTGLRTASEHDRQAELPGQENPS
jgi:hypothetical protein